MPSSNPTWEAGKRRTKERRKVFKLGARGSEKIARLIRPRN